MLRIVYERSKSSGKIFISLEHGVTEEADCNCCSYESWECLAVEEVENENQILEAVASLLFWNIEFNTNGLGPKPSFRVAK